MKRRAVALGLVLVLILSVWLLGTYASRMTDRRIDRSVGTHLAGLEARVRALETLIGGGRQAAIVSQMILNNFFISSTVYADLVPVGPEVTVRVGPVGKVRVELSAFFSFQVRTNSAGPVTDANLGYLSFEVTDAAAAVVLAPDDDRAISGGVTSRVEDGVGSETEIEGVYTRTMDIDDLPSGDLTFTVKGRREGASIFDPSVKRRLLSVTPY